MFEIGGGLREARERRGLELAAVERDTRISQRWLRALEEERFDSLPERVYALGFVRTYADYLGLDGQLFVDELSSRLSPEDEPEVPMAMHAVQQRRPGSAWVLAIAAAGAVAVVVGVIVLSTSTNRPRHPGLRPPARVVEPTRPSPTTTTTPAPATHPARPQLATLVLRATSGRCWLDARRGSPNGRELDTGTLELGQSLRLTGRRIWIRLGAPKTLQATLNERSVSLPAITPVDVVVTAHAVRLAAAQG